MLMPLSEHVDDDVVEAAAVNEAAEANDGDDVEAVEAVLLKADEGESVPLAH